MSSAHGSTTLLVSCRSVSRNGSPASAASVSHRPVGSPPERMFSTRTWLARSSPTRPAARPQGLNGLGGSRAGTPSLMASAFSTRAASGPSDRPCSSPVTATASADSTAWPAPGGGKPLQHGRGKPEDLAVTLPDEPGDRAVPPDGVQPLPVPAQPREPLDRIGISTSPHRARSAARSAARSRTGPPSSSTADRRLGAAAARNSSLATSGSETLSDEARPGLWPINRPTAVAVRAWRRPGSRCRPGVRLAPACPDTVDQPGELRLAEHSPQFGGIYPT